MPRLDHEQALAHWRRNDEAKRDLDRSSDPEGLAFGLYDDFPTWLNRYYAYFQGRVVERFLGQIELDPESRILEIGCGSGRWCQRLRLRGQRSVVGLDIGQRQLAANRRHYGAAPWFVAGIGSRLPFRDASQELVYTVAVLHHLPREQQGQALDEIRRVLRPGGALFVLESTETDSTSPHLFPRPLDGWVDLLEDHGFKVRERAGQEFIDFRRIVRPVRRLVRRSAGGSQAGGAAPGSAHGARLTTAERLFHLPFLPLVALAYPLELALSRWARPERAHYACLLAKRRRTPA